jgi:hypothetical protein
MPWEGDRFTPATAHPEVAERDELAQDRERRHAARRFFRAAPPYCIEFDASERRCCARRRRRRLNRTDGSTPWPAAIKPVAVGGTPNKRKADYDGAVRHGDYAGCPNPSRRRDPSGPLSQVALHPIRAFPVRRHPDPIRWLIIGWRGRHIGDGRRRVHRRRCINRRPDDHGRNPNPNAESPTPPSLSFVRHRRNANGD